MIKQVFISQGRLRYIWRALIFLILVLFALPWLFAKPLDWAWGGLRLQDSLNPAATAFEEGAWFLYAFVATLAFALYEHRRVDGYGLPLRSALRAPIWEGLLAGVLLAGIVALGMYAFGGLRIIGFAHTDQRGLDALAWFGAMIVAGMTEEFVFRGYLLQALWRSFGFWIASLLTTAVFVALHYFFKSGENIWDVITLAGLALLLCDTVRRTGSLWWAVGFHVAYDFMQFFVIGTPNGGRVPVGRLLDVSFPGPAWLTGGVLGTEASVLMYPGIVLLWLYVVWRYPLRGRAAASNSLCIDVGVN